MWTVLKCFCLNSVFNEYFRGFSVKLVFKLFFWGIPCEILIQLDSNRWFDVVSPRTVTVIFCHSVIFYDFSNHGIKQWIKLFAFPKNSAQNFIMTTVQLIINW